MTPQPQVVSTDGANETTTNILSLVPAPSATVAPTRQEQQFLEQERRVAEEAARQQKTLTRVLEGARKGTLYDQDVEYALQRLDPNDPAQEAMRSEIVSRWALTRSEHMAENVSPRAHYTAYDDPRTKTELLDRVDEDICSGGRSKPGAVYGEAYEKGQFQDRRQEWYKRFQEGPYLYTAAHDIVAADVIHPPPPNSSLGPRVLEEAQCRFLIEEYAAGRMQADMAFAALHPRYKEPVGAERWRQQLDQATQRRMRRDLDVQEVLDPESLSIMMRACNRNEKLDPNDLLAVVIAERQAEREPHAALAEAIIARSADGEEELLMAEHDERTVEFRHKIRDGGAPMLIDLRMLNEPKHESGTRSAGTKIASALEQPDRMAADAALAEVRRLAKTGGFGPAVQTERYSLCRTTSVRVLYDNTDPVQREIATRIHAGMSAHIRHQQAEVGAQRRLRIIEEAAALTRARQAGPKDRAACALDRDIRLGAPDLSPAETIELLRDDTLRSYD